MDGAGHFAAVAHHVHHRALPACGHALDAGRDHVDGGEVLGLHGVGKGLGRELGGGCALGRTRRVDQHVDGAERGFGRVQGHQGGRGVAQIGGHGVDALGGKCGLQLGACGLEVGAVTRDQAHTGAFGQKAPRTGQANAFAAAGDEDVFVA